MKLSEMHAKLLAAGFNWDLSEEDGQGQIVIYTGMKLANDEDDDPEVVEFEG